MQSTATGDRAGAVPSRHSNARSSPGAQRTTRHRETAALFREYRRSRSVTLRNELVLRHDRLVRYLVSRFSAVGPLTQDDLMQVGYIGLIAAVERYDPEMGVQFSTFATPTVIGIVRRFLRDKTWFLTAPRRIRDLSVSLGPLRERLELQLGRVPTVQDVAQAAGVDEEQVLLAMEVDLIYHPASLETGVAEGDGELSYHEAVGRPDPDLEEIATRDWVRSALAGLEERERSVIRERFFGECTQAQVASKLGISQMHVSRIERRALERLKTLLPPA
jgi:RNA polymerase sigma-B factor